MDVMVKSSESLPARVDRRSERTRTAIVAAMTQLVFRDGLAAVTLARVAEQANVGRSTLYLHFANRDALLTASIEPLFRSLALFCLTDKPDPRLTDLLRHFWEGRKFAATMLTGRTGAAMLQQLTDCFASALDARQGKQLLLAAYLAHATIGVLSGWLRGRLPGTAADIAEALHRFGHRTLD